MVPMKREDGTLSRMQVLNAIELHLLTITTIAIEVLPTMRELFVEHPEYFLIAMGVSRAINMYLRATTTQPLA